MKHNLVVLLLCFTCAAQAQNIYSADGITPQLLSHADAVVRDDETNVTIKSIDGASVQVKHVVTVLNKNGDDEAGLDLYYSKTDETIKSVKGMVFDEKGVAVKKIAEHDFKDEGTTDGFSLYEDERVKFYHPGITTYPFTIEYDYELNLNQTLLLPDWHPNYEDRLSVAHSIFSVSAQPDFIIRYKEKNYQGQCLTAEKNGIKSYTWEIINTKALKPEPLSPSNQDLAISVQITPVNFSYAGIKGTFTNWQEFGSFIYDKLLKDRRTLPPETIAYIKDLTANIPDPKLKAKKIYEYVQQKTRYVSIDIGIGGYRPFSATEVDNTSYGDCKALVNYTQALLDAVGIRSWYVLNKAGGHKQSAMPDFASMNQFNHVILCMPFKNDTTWVDCTSKENPFGFLGDFTDDRDVIACTPAGGILLHTPKYTAEGSKQIRTANFMIGANGALSGQMETKLSGWQYDDRNDLVKEAFAEQVKKLSEIYPIQNLNIKSYKLDQDKGLNPVTTETMTLQADDFMAANGDRYFITPNAASRYIKPLEDVMNRSLPVHINRGYHDEDELNYTLPDGFKIGNKPADIHIEKPFGKYSLTMQINGNKLVYKRMLQINDGTWSKDTYTDLVDFYQTVYDADNFALMLQKQ